MSFTLSTTRKDIYLPFPYVFSDEFEARGERERREKPREEAMDESSSWELPITWRIIPVSKWLITMVSK